MKSDAEFLADLPDRLVGDHPGGLIHPDQAGGPAYHRILEHLKILYYGLSETERSNPEVVRDRFVRAIDRLQTVSATIESGLKEAGVSS